MKPLLVNFTFAMLATLSLFLVARTFTMPILWFLIGLSVWTLFIWNYFRAHQKANRRKHMERLFSLHWRNRRNFS
ncbi:hypothetical protein ACJVDH_04830 [Pedobacter sp. AW1-32]|uniref:hypothetical protein n=1 Tax=Pedobacter sp. AW1-32 TaxID=3383026 RepID=UPI003FF0EA3E